MKPGWCGAERVQIQRLMACDGMNAQQRFCDPCADAACAKRALAIMFCKRRSVAQSERADRLWERCNET
jgi:hypothetical protein